MGRGPILEKRSAESHGGSRRETGRNQSIDGRSQKFMKHLGGRGGCRRFRFLLAVRLLGLRDLAAQVAGLLPAERVFRTFEKTRVLRVRGDHASPREDLHQCIGSTHQMQAGEQGEQKMEELLQIDSISSEAQGRGNVAKAVAGGKKKSRGTRGEILLDPWSFRIHRSLIDLNRRGWGSWRMANC